MQLEFFGAAGEVTGSCHILTVGGRRLLLDCGMIQGGAAADERNRAAFPFDAAQVDAVILSHAHIDHCGRLPLLRNRGFRGPVYANPACRDLVRILLADGATMAERDAERENRRRKKAGDARRVEPLYTLEDAQAVLQLFRTVRYGHAMEVLPGVELVFRDAGHILGSASVWLRLREGDLERRLVFSGDVGQFDTPILCDPESGPGADLVLMESTYGDRRHRDRDATRAGVRLDPAGGARRRRQRADPGLRGRAQPGNPVRARDALRGLGARRLADLPRQPDGDRGDRGLLEARQPVRRGSAAVARAGAQPAAAAEPETEPHGGRIDGHQPDPAWRDRDRRQRHVHRRAHRAPPQAQSRPARVRHRLQRFPGPGHDRPRDRRRTRVRAHSRRTDQGRGPGPHAGRILRARRPAGPAALV